MHGRKLGGLSTLEARRTFSWQAASPSLKSLPRDDSSSANASSVRLCSWERCSNHLVSPSTTVGPICVRSDVIRTSDGDRRTSAAARALQEPPVGALPLTSCPVAPGR
jgi:hypothetical protein